jgi:predicted RNase H-like nuclease
MDNERVLGVDACKAGWVGVALTDERVTAYFAVMITELVALANQGVPTSVVAVDMPIGLPDTTPRKADEEARAALGSLRSSVFMTPCRGVLTAVDHDSASRRNRELAGAGISIQAFSLLRKMREVDDWAHDTEQRFVEVHPEVSFATLAGGPLTIGKKTWAGAELRRRLLAGDGVVFDADLGEAGRRATVDDILDAGAAAWTARRVLRGEASSRPDPPQVFSDGMPSAIWS